MAGLEGDGRGQGRNTLDNATAGNVLFLRLGSEIAGVYNIIRRYNFITDIIRSIYFFNLVFQTL